MTTLNHFFLSGEIDLAERMRDALAKERLAVTGGGLETLRMLGWRMLPGAIARQLPGLLDIGLADILVGGWNKSHALQKQLMKSAKSPGKDMFLPLADHKLKSAHEPYVALMKDGQEVVRLPFSVSIELSVQGAVLRIRDGAIQEIQTGEIKGKGSLKCGGAILAEKELQPIALPGTLKVYPQAA
jgi:hypothetical protein